MDLIIYAVLMDTYIVISEDTLHEMYRLLLLSEILCYRAAATL